MTRVVSPEAPIGLLAAMPDELEAVLGDFQKPRRDTIIGDNTFIAGELYDHNVVAVIAGIGKTAAASATTLLINRFGAGSIILTGTAGSVSETLSIGDVVVGEDFVHHDFNASPLHRRYVIPSLGIARIPADGSLVTRAVVAAKGFVKEELRGKQAVEQGLIFSGDQVMNAARIAELRKHFPDALAVEMEGAAVAQICLANQRPCTAIRAISDGGDTGAFEDFVNDYCNLYASGIISRLIRAWDQD